MALRNALGAIALDSTVQSVLTAIGGVFTTRNQSATVTGNLAAANAAVDGTTDLSMLGSVRVQVTGTWAGTLTFEVSNDGTNWVSRTLTSAGLSLASTTTGNGMWAGDIGARYFRVRESAYTSGTAAVTVFYTAVAHTPFTANTATSLSAGTNTIGYLATGTYFTQTTTVGFNTNGVKLSAASLFELSWVNPTANAGYLKFFNVATTPTIGTTVPVYAMTIAANSNGTLTFPPVGKRFSVGLYMSTTGGSALTDSQTGPAGIVYTGTFV